MDPICNVMIQNHVSAVLFLAPPIRVYVGVWVYVFFFSPSIKVCMCVLAETSDCWVADLNRFPRLDWMIGWTAASEPTADNNLAPLLVKANN